MSRTVSPAAVFGALCLAVLLGHAASSRAQAPAAPRYAPLDQPGPPLSVPADKLAASLDCTGNLGDARFDPVLLVPGTGSEPATAFSWNYERAFRQTGRPFCAVHLPEFTMADIQVSAEYIVNAIRTMRANSLRPIAILGWSQGGMSPRWALRFWPDTRAMVSQLIALDPSNHGTLDASAACLTVPQIVCTPAIWQQAANSNFLTALNAGGETFAGIAYTVVFSATDEVVVPNKTAASSSSLNTGGGTIANIEVQSVCPDDVSEHNAMGTYDPVGYALAVDALDHGGPADPSRVSSAVCLEATQPGVAPKNFAANFANLIANEGASDQAARKVDREPRLKSYVFAQ